MGKRPPSRSRWCSNRNIRLSLHAPYFINLNAREAEKIQASQLKTDTIGSSRRAMRRKGCGFPRGLLYGCSPEETYDNVKKYLLESKTNWPRKSSINLRGSDGKVSQFGTLDELLNLVARNRRSGSMHRFCALARQNGKNNSYEEFCVYLLD